MVEAVPYLIEDVLKAQGTNFLAAADWDVRIVQDCLLVTAQHPPSSRATARALFDALGNGKVF